MKKLLYLVVLLIMPITGWGQTAVITGTAVGIGQTLVNPVTLQVQLIGCGQSTPTILPSGSVISNNYSVTANPTTFVATSTVYGNDIVQCGTQSLSTYAVTWNINNRPASPTGIYRVIEGQTCNISNGTCKPIGFTPPVVTNATNSMCAAGFNLQGYNSNFIPQCVQAPAVGPPGPTGPAGGANLAAGVTTLVKGTGTINQIVAATPGTDYIAPGTAAGGVLGGTYPNPTTTSLIKVAPTATQTVTQPIVSSVQTTLQANSTNGVFNEELFTGATVALRVNAAVAACGTQASCYVVIPTNAPTGSGWATPPSSVSIEDNRFSNGIGGFANGVPDFHFYHQYLVNAQGLQAWETLVGTTNSGPWALDLETIATDVAPQPTAHDGIHGNTGGLAIFSHRLGGNRGLWGANINIQYDNFTNVADGLEIDLGNNSTVADDPGDGSAGIALNLIGGTNTNRRSGIAILIGNVATQSNSGFVTAIGVNAYRDIGINLASSSTKLADISIALPDSLATKTAISVSSSTIANAQFAVFDDGSVRGTNIRGQMLYAIGAPVASLQGEQIGFNQSGNQDMSFANFHSSGPTGGFNFYSALNGASLASPIFKIDGAAGAVSWGAVGTVISDSAVVAQIGIATVGSVACIKASSPRTIGYCTGTSSASTCTCN